MEDMKVYEAPVCSTVAFKGRRVICTSPTFENNYGSENKAGGQVNWVDNGEF